MSADRMNHNDPLSLSILEEIDPLCDRFEQAWRSGQEPRIEDYVVQASERTRPALIRSLLRVEIACRMQKRETILPSDYTPRFPEHASLIDSLLGLSPKRDSSSAPAVPVFHALAGPEDSGLVPDTVLDRAGVQTVAPSPRLFGDYEILKELGKGGMGIVFLARQRSANRLVALKLIRLDRLEHLPPEQRQEWLDRFRTEGQAAARLRHENIVTVYEVGTVGDTPFYSMEYIEGQSLDPKLRDGPLPNARAAAYVEQIARAVHCAHESHILHRDLKPQNILIDTQGRSYVTDFGLAKWKEAEGPTHTGQILGSPPYMSPEQTTDAAGVTEATDVYSLGATLYALVTGRPPFQAASVAETLYQVRHHEPVAPRLLNPATDRDLETIVLQCLRKEPGRRYPSALSLADDLRAYLEGRPIKARPVRSWQRLWMWSRRNPALAASLVSLILALTGGTIISTFFGIDSANQAENARNKATELESTLASSLWVPMGLNSSRFGALDEPLIDAEISALWELSRTRTGRVWYRFLDKAIRDPTRGRQLRARADYALHAALGLDPDKRLEIQGLLFDQLARDTLDQEQKVDLVLTLAALGGFTSHDAKAVRQVISQTLNGTTDREALSELGRGLVAVVGGLESRDAAQAATAFIQGIDKTKDPFVRHNLVMGLQTVATRLEPRDAALVANTVFQVDIFPDLLPCLMAVVDRLEPTDAAQAAGSLTQQIISRGDHESERTRVRVLAVLAGRLRAVDAAQTTTIITEAMSTATDPRVMGALAVSLAALADHVDACRVPPTVFMLAEAISKNTDPYVLKDLAQTLVLLAGRLESRVAAEVAVRLSQAMDRTVDPARVHEFARIPRNPSIHPLARHPLHELSDSLVAVAGRLEAHDADPTCARLSHSMRLTTDPTSLYELGRSLGAVAGRLEPPAATRYSDEAVMLAEAMTRTENLYFQGDFAKALATVAAHLEPHHANRVCGKAAATLTEALLRNAPDSRAQMSIPGLIPGLKAIAGRLGPGDAAQAATSIARALPETTYPSQVLVALAESLAAVASSLRSQDAARTLVTLTMEMASERIANNPTIRTYDTYERQALERARTAIVARIQPHDAAESTIALTQAMSKTTNPDALGILAQGWAALTSRLEPREAATVFTNAMSKYAAMKEYPASSVLAFSAEGLAVVADRLEPREAAQAVAAVTLAMKRTTDPFTLGRLAEALPSAVDRLEASEANRVCCEAATTLVKVALDTYGDSFGIEAGLAALAHRLEARDAAQLASTLTQAFTSSAMREVAVPAQEKPRREEPRQIRPLLARCLTAVAGRLEPVDAANIAVSLGQTISKATVLGSTESLVPLIAAFAPYWKPHDAAAVAARLAQAMSDPRLFQGPPFYLTLSHGLRAVAPRLESPEVARMAGVLLEVISKTSHREARQLHTQTLSVLLARLDRSQRIKEVSAAVGIQAGTDRWVGVPLFLSSALQPLPEPLSAQVVVDVLKQPLCVGAARRAVLDHLGAYYGRSFHDHWDFVRFAQEQQLGLDLMSPPQRPTATVVRENQ
jgi:serine/threonine protein kinase